MFLRCLRLLSAVGLRESKTELGFAINPPLRRWSSYYKDSRGYEHFSKPSSSSSSPTGIHSPKVIGGCLALVCGGYYVSSIEEVPYTHRKHAMLFVSPQQEKFLGQQMFAQVKQEAAQKGTLLPESHTYVKLVRKIGSKIAEVAVDGYGGGSYTHMQNMEWEFAVIHDPQPNAFVVPGGKVVVYSGLLEMLRTEDELASVLAHEAAHVLARHTGERISQGGMLTIVRLVLWAVTGINLPNAAVVLGIILPYSRRAETEADLIGIQLMARACYDPTAAMSMLHKLHQHGEAEEKQMGVRVPTLLRTHPLTERRVEDVKGNLPQAVRLLEASDCQPRAESFADSMASFIFRR